MRKGVQKPCTPYPKVGSVLQSRFKIVKWLGRGGFGRVCEAHDIECGCSVAIKLFDGTADDMYRERFRHEGALLRSFPKRWHRWLSSCKRDRDRRIHPDGEYPFPRFVAEGTYSYRCHGVDGDRPYFVMELLQSYETSEKHPKSYGGDEHCVVCGQHEGRLSRGIKTVSCRKSGFPSKDEEVAKFIRAICHAAAFLHSIGITHRDIKGGNVMHRDGHPVLIDFGIVRERSRYAYNFSEIVTMRDHRIWGTAGTSDPNLLVGKDVGPASDVFSIGMLIRGCFPDHIPYVWQRIVERSTNLDPQRRYQSMAEMIGAIASRKSLSELNIKRAAEKIRTEEIQRQQRASIACAKSVNWKTWGNVKEVSLHCGDKRRKSVFCDKFIAVDLHHQAWKVDGPVRFESRAVILVRGPGLLEVDFAGCVGVTIVLRDGVTLHNTTKVNASKEKSVYHVETGCYLNFVHIKRHNHERGGQRVFTSLEGLSYVMYGGPRTVDDIRALWRERSAGTLPDNRLIFPGY